MTYDSSNWEIVKQEDKFGYLDNPFYDTLNIQKIPGKEPDVANPPEFDEIEDYSN